MPKPKIEFEGIGTHWWIEILDDDDHQDIKKAIINTVEQFNQDYSRFLPDSYIGKLNSEKVLHRPPRELIDMLLFAKDMYVVSEGAFNISVGGELAHRGYGKGSKQAGIDRDLWDHVTMGDDIITIPDTVDVDLGGFGKGWLIDMLADLLKKSGHPYFVINGGGDILVSSLTPIELALEHPTNTTKMIGTTRITQGALGASSNEKRVWIMNDKPQRHIIDPHHLSDDANDVTATFVRAETALIADTMATILFINPALNKQLSERYELQTIII